MINPPEQRALPPSLSSLILQTRKCDTEDTTTLDSLKIELNEAITVVSREVSLECMQKFEGILVRIRELTRKKGKFNEFEYLIVEIIALYYLSFCYSGLKYTKELLKNNQLFLLKMTQLLKSYRNTNDIFPPKNFRLNEIIVNFQLLSCYHLSQVGRNQEALQKAVKAYDLLLTIFRSIQREYTHQLISHRNYGCENVYFSQIILKKSFPIVKEIATYPNSDISWENSSLVQIKNSISSWKLNPEHNIFQLTSKLGIKEKVTQTEKRSILGLKDQNQKKTKDQTGPSIEEIVKIKLFSMDQFYQKDDIVYEISEKNFKIKLQYLTVAIFFMATQNRQAQFAKSYLWPSVQKNKLKKSQFFHLKAIETSFRYVQSNRSLMTEIIIDYHKFFAKDLNPISEENTFVNSSQFTSNLLIAGQRPLFQHNSLENNLKKTLKKKEKAKRSPHKKSISRQKKKKKEEEEIFYMLTKNKSKTSHSIDYSDPISMQNKSREKRPRFCSKSLTKKRRRSKKIR